LNRIGLQIGVNTGLNLNKLISPKPGAKVLKVPKEPREILQQAHLRASQKQRDDSKSADRVIENKNLTQNKNKLEVNQIVNTNTPALEKEPCVLGSENNTQIESLPSYQRVPSPQGAAPVLAPLTPNQNPKSPIMLRRQVEDGPHRTMKKKEADTSFDKSDISGFT